ncbi:MAG: hypothetical protein JW771_03980 [Candidatus Thermoplasmatota archaeon]|nr:hypothetical protein [Candidatus Thermoplasmatota archaeon]
MNVEAVISKGGAYPFRVSNATSAPNDSATLPSWPVSLTIDPGVEIWYRVGSGDPVNHDGCKALVLQPISKTLGHSMVRVVGLGLGTQDVNMNAKVATIDLSGDWIFDDYEIVGFTYTCDDSETTMHAIPNALKNLTTSMTQVGTFRQTEVNKLKYDLESGKSLGEGISVDFTAELKYDEIKVSAELAYVTSELRENDTENITFKKIEFLGTQDQSNAILWKLENGSGTPTWTWVSKEKDDQDREYDLHCNGKTISKVRSAVYSEGANINNREGMSRSSDISLGLKVKPKF